LNFEGAFTALVTPFTPEGEVDLPAFKALVESQIKAGINGLVPLGTTGESPTISAEEQELVLTTCIAVNDKRVTIIAGTGSNNTAEAVKKTQHAKDLGADACLVCNPYYNKPNQEGMRRHFAAIAAVGLPIVLYNIPGRTGCQMTVDTIVGLRKEFPVIVAVKEATGSLDMASEICSRCDIIVLSGDDSLTLPLMSVGAKGVVSVLSNLSPKRVLAITEPALKGDFTAARAAHLDSFPLMRTMFCEVNPQPIKHAMHIAGAIPSPFMRLPLIECTEETCEALKAIMKEKPI